jgi:hypothetical protein
MTLRINTAPPKRPAAVELTEKQFQQQVRDLALLTGWRAYHTFDSRRSDPGFPDLAMVNRTQGRFIFIELKRHDGTVSDDQQSWLASISEAGFEADVWRPADMPRIQRILRGQSIPTGRKPEEFR